MTTTTQILSILSPVRIYGVDDFENMSIALVPQGENYAAISTLNERRSFKQIQLMRRYEQMTMGIKGKCVAGCHYFTDGEKHHEHCERGIFQPALLKKEHFVCEVAEEEIPQAVGKQMSTQAALAAKKKVWFKGFEICKEVGGDSVVNRTAKVYFLTIGNRQRLGLGNDYNERISDNYTIHDFIHELDRYNRTATDKISITPTLHFVEELLKTE